MNSRIRQQIWRWVRGLSVLGFGIFGVVSVFQSTQFLTLETAQLGHETHRPQSQFVGQNLSDIPWDLAPTHAETGDEKLEFAVSAAPYMPNAAETDDYHCFVIDPRLERDVMVTGVAVMPDNKRTVHHAILFKIEGSVRLEALERDRASGGKGWTCFGGPDVGGPAAGGNWVGAWAPGAGDGHFPDGVGIPLPKDALIVMQVHYNLLNGFSADRSRVALSIAPEGKKLTSLSTGLNIAPVELPCADELNTPACNRETVIRENITKFGPIAGLVSKQMLGICKQTLEQYQNAIGNASRLTGTCDRVTNTDLTLHAVAGHMHMRGQSIKLELNPDTNARKTLLHIPRWDFHWQGNYWFRQPIQVKQGDVIRITCTFDNSTANQPVIAGQPLEPRYVVWGEGTTDEMCLGVTMESR